MYIRSTGLLQNDVISFCINSVELTYTHNNYILIEGLRSKVANPLNQ